MGAGTEQFDTLIDRVAAAPSDVGTVEFDLSAANCPVGTQLTVGSAVIEVTSKPHDGCVKFADRCGVEAARWVNSRKDLRLRGICAVVVEAGSVAPADSISKR